MSVEKLIGYDTYITTNKQSFVEERAREFTENEIYSVIEKIEEYYQEEYGQSNYDIESDNDGIFQETLDDFYHNALEAYSDIYDIIKETLEKDLDNMLLKSIEAKLNEETLLDITVLDSFSKSIRISVDNFNEGTSFDVDKLIKIQVEDAFIDYEIDMQARRNVSNNIRLNFTPYSPINVEVNLYTAYILNDLNIEKEIYVEPVTK